MVKRIKRKIELMTQDLDKNIRIAAYVTLGVILWMLTGVFSSTETPKTEQATNLIKTVAIEEIHAQKYTETVTISGRSFPETLADVAAETDGSIKKVFVEQGDMVKKGQPLLQIEMATRQEQLKAAKARLKEAKALYKAAKNLNKEGYRSATTLATREAELANAEQALATVKQDITYTSMPSPISGVVEKRNVDEGDYVGIGDTAFQIINQEQFVIVGHLPQKDQHKVSRDQNASAKLINGQEVKGKIRFVATNADEITKTYRTEVVVDAVSETIPTGMTAHITIPINTTTAHRIPQSALTLSDAGTLGIKYVNDDKRVVFKEVESLSNDLQGLWITGLPETVRLIRLGQSNVSPGDEVAFNVIPPEETEEK